MKAVVIRIIRLFAGLFLFAVGIVMTINANIGLQPWDVFHQGLSHILNMTIGQASIIVGILLIIMNTFFGEKLGWGTICNMLFIGLFIDFLMLNNLIPIFESIIISVIMMLLGLFIIGVASYFYIGAGLGTGPRDGLMVVLTKKTKKSVRLIRNSIEVTVSIIGYLLGGNIGIGTAITAITIGYFVQLSFKLFKFDVTEVQHRYIDEDVKFIYKRLSKADTKLEDN